MGGFGDRITKTCQCGTKLLTDGYWIQGSYCTKSWWIFLAFGMLERPVQHHSMEYKDPTKKSPLRPPYQARIMFASPKSKSLITSNKINDHFRD